MVLLLFIMDKKCRNKKLKHSVTSKARKMMFGKSRITGIKFLVTK